MIKQIFPLVLFILSSCFKEEPNDVPPVRPIDTRRYAEVQFYTSDSSLEKNMPYFTVSYDSSVYTLNYRDALPYCGDDFLYPVPIPVGETVTIEVSMQKNMDTIYKSYKLKFDRETCYTYDLK